MIVLIRSSPGIGAGMGEEMLINAVSTYQKSIWLPLNKRCVWGGVFMYVNVLHRDFMSFQYKEKLGCFFSTPAINIQLALCPLQCWFRMSPNT